MQLSYEHYLDKVLGGWIGKCIGGTIGARFEGNKDWIEISPEEMFPGTVPPNDDLDLQILWLKVLEEKGAALTSDDLAEAWLEGCWYPFNEYGIFRKNYRLGIHPPESGRFGNQFWETGMGCPIRAEIWGYAFPGAPDLAAEYARRDGVLDHTEESVGAERLFAAMASMAFFVDDYRVLYERFKHYLPIGTPVARLTEEAFRAHEEGLSLRDARKRLMLLAGNPEACDARTNVPFTFLGLLYGGEDLEETMLATLRCGYDTDCTMATAGALLGQMLGASRIPTHLKEAIGDELVVGIEYARDDMALSALARDTARIGVLLSRDLKTGLDITDAPPLGPLPEVLPKPRLEVEYHGLPAAAPGETVSVTLSLSGYEGQVSVTGSADWNVFPEVQGLERGRATFSLRARPDAKTWPQKHLFDVQLEGRTVGTFGVAGTGLWQVLGVFYDPLPDPEDNLEWGRRFPHHFVNLHKAYLPEPPKNPDQLYLEFSKLLGRPALIPSREHEIDVTSLVGLSGAYCAYLARTFLVPEARWAYLVVGNSDGYKLYFNGELLGEEDEQPVWTPFNRAYRVKLRSGENHIIVKLVKRSDTLRFTLGLREGRDEVRMGLDKRGYNHEDWLIDTEDKMPQLEPQLQPAQLNVTALARVSSVDLA
ncbi:hypothetical protein BH24DEI2_BH24DEI2_22050 [soil metagenome]